MPKDNILHQKGDYYVVKHPKKGFEVYKNQGTAARRVSTIGFEGDEGWRRVHQEIDRRIGDDSKKDVGLAHGGKAKRRADRRR